MRQYHTNIWGLHNLDCKYKGPLGGKSLSGVTWVGKEVFLDEERLY